MCKFHPMRESDGDLTMKDLKEELLSDTGIMEPPKCQADTINEDRLGDETNIADCNKNELQIEDKTHNNTYSSTCPSRMKDMMASSSTTKVAPPYIPKRRSRKRKNNVRTNPFRRPRFQPKVERSCENRDDVDLLTSIKIDLRNYITKPSQPLNLLSSYGIRHLLFKKMEDKTNSLRGKLTGKQLLLVDAAMSLQSLDEVCRLLNENIDMLFLIIAYVNSMDDFSY